MLFLEVQRGDASEFSEELLVRGARANGYCVLRSKNPAIPNAIAALLLHIRHDDQRIPSTGSGCPLLFSQATNMTRPDCGT